jgi:predicted nucleic acid-binding protein
MQIRAACGLPLRQRRGSPPQHDLHFHPRTPRAHHARQRIGRLPATVFVRAADALHLTCAAEEGFMAIHTNDRHTLAAAPDLGLHPVSL